MLASYLVDVRGIFPTSSCNSDSSTARRTISSAFRLRSAGTKMTTQTASQTVLAQCPACDKRFTRSSTKIACVNCKTEFHSLCSRNLPKRSSGAFRLCCDVDKTRAVNTSSDISSDNISAPPSFDIDAIANSSQDGIFDRALEETIASILTSAVTFRNFINFFNLKQHNYILNYDSNSLDLIFATYDFLDVRLESACIEPVDSYHPPLSFSASVTTSPITDQRYIS